MPEFVQAKGEEECCFDNVEYPKVFGVDCPNEDNDVSVEYAECEVPSW